MSGELVARRFRLGEQVGSGGSGRVYRALDERNGETVAVKILPGDGFIVAERLAREVQVLTLLNHPGIVRYIDHGALGGGDYYLVMEWLEGEDLAARLAREPLSVSTAMEIVTAVADALGHAHAHHVVHRDIKPANIFLPKVPGGMGTKVVDFGIARPIERASLRSPLARTHAATMSGLPIGTVGYMAPEQARGERTVDARADVFALGSLLFECLADRRAFEGEHAVAVLAKILFESPPRVGRVAKSPISPWLEDLVAAMLSLDPDKRPADAGAVARVLRENRATMHAADTSVPSSRVLTALERRLATAVAVRPHASVEEARISEVAREHHLLLERLVDGTRVAILRTGESAADTVSRAARLALSLRPFGAVAVATSFDDGDFGRATGTVIDRVFLQLEDVAGASSSLVVVDDLTAGLIDGAFEIVPGPQGNRSSAPVRVLSGPRSDQDPRRLLLGKPAPFVGRDKELAILSSTLSATLSEPAASAVFVLALAGAGKSRLRHEMLAAASKEHPALRVFMVRAEPSRQSSALGVVGALVASEARLRDDDDPRLRRTKLIERLRPVVPLEQLERVTEFLGELAGVPPEAPSLLFQGAKGDPRRMWTETTRAVEDWLTGELVLGPVILVLEDVQWIDTQSLHLFADLLDRPERALFVLGLGRPAARTLIANTGWQSRPLQILQLPPLGARASEQLIRGALGDGIGRERIDAIIGRGEGHAFFLEELVRAEAEGRGASAPPTVVAMLQERFDRFETDARRILRAASVFGLEFTRAGLTQLLDEAGAANAWLDPWLETLVKREVIARAERSRFSREDTFAFRHDIIHESIYATLTDDDRKRGHLLAARWFESTNERDTALLGVHFERGGDAESAANAFATAAEQAFKRMDFAIASSLCERSIDNGAAEGTLGRVRWVQSAIALYSRTMDDTERFGSNAFELLPSGSTHWFHTATVMVTLAAFGRPHLLGTIVSKVMEAGIPDASVLGMAPIRTWALCSNMLYMAGQYPLAAEFDGRIDQCAAPAVARESVTQAWVHFARHVKASYCSGDPEYTLDEAEKAAVILDQSSDEILVWVRIEQAKAAGLIGDFELAEQLLRRAMAVAGNDNMWAAGLGRHRLARILTFLGRFDEAREHQREAIRLFHEIAMPIMAAIGDNHVALIELAAGEYEAAEAAILRAQELLFAVPPIRTFALATQALVALRRGNPEAARSALDDAESSLPMSGLINDGESLYDLAWIETHLALGNREEAQRRARKAVERLDDRASRITRPDYRESFKRAVPENARIYARAVELEQVQA